MLLSAIAALPLWKYMAGREMFFLNDALYQHYPWQAVITSLLSLAPGSLPLWNPFMFCGSPLLADPQFQVLYPPALVYRFLPYASANGWFVAFHAALAAAGMAAFLLEKGCALRHAAIGALGLALGAHPAMLAAIPPVLSAAAWLPWVALFARKLAWAPGLANAVGLGLVLGWLSLAGSPQYIVYAAVLASIVLYAENAKPARPFRLGALSIAVAALAAAAMWVPFLSYLPETGRATALPANYAAAGALAPWQILGYLSPMAFLPRSEVTLLMAGNLWLTLHFIGVVGLAFAATAVAFLRWKETGAPLALAALGILLGLGPWLPGVGQFLNYLPPFSYMQHAGMWAGLADFGLAWLAALGAREVEKRISGKDGRRFLDWLLLGAVFLGMAGGVTRLMLAWYIRRWGHAAGLLAANLGSVLHPATILVVLALLFWLARRREIRASGAIVASGVLLFLELLMVRAAFQPSAKPAWLLEPGETEKAIFLDSSKMGYFRVFISPRHQMMFMDEGEGLEGVSRHIRASFRSNLPAAAGMLDVDGSNPLRPKALDALLDRAKMAKAPWREPAQGILNDLGVRYLVTRGPIPGTGWEPIKRGYVWIYRNPGGHSQTWVEPKSAGREIQGASWPGEHAVTVEMDRPGTLVISETALRGWRLVRAPMGAKLSLWRGTLLGVSLPAGRHGVRLRYDPPEAKVGLASSLAALAAVLILGLAGLVSGRRASRAR